MNELQKLKKSQDESAQKLRDKVAKLVKKREKVVEQRIACCDFGDKTTLSSMEDEIASEIRGIRRTAKTLLGVKL